MKRSDDQKSVVQRQEFSHLMSGGDNSQDQEREEENKTIRDGFILEKKICDFSHFSYAFLDLTDLCNVLLLYMSLFKIAFLFKD